MSAMVTSSWQTDVVPPYSAKLRASWELLYAFISAWFLSRKDPEKIAQFAAVSRSFVTKLHRREVSVAWQLSVQMDEYLHRLCQALGADALKKGLRVDQFITARHGQRLTTKNNDIVKALSDITWADSGGRWNSLRVLGTARQVISYVIDVPDTWHECSIFILQHGKE